MRKLCESKPLTLSIMYSMIYVNYKDSQKLLLYSIPRRIVNIRRMRARVLYYLACVCVSAIYKALKKVIFLVVYYYMYLKALHKVFNLQILSNVFF
jgi:hypothetical protein